MTSKDLERAQKQAKRAAKNAKSLSDLVTNLISENKKIVDIKKVAKSKSRSKSKSRAANISGLRLPIKGDILVACGETDPIGAKSNGVHIASSGKSTVVTPANGTVRYTGAFKNYGQMVIVEHTQNTYSLIAGLGTIKAVVGQDITGGEPVGTTRNSANSEKNTIYYELRREEKPLDPLKALKNL